MPTDIPKLALGLWPRFVGLLAAIRWEAQFKLAKCCMRASITMSDIGVFLAEPVLARYQTLNGGEVPTRMPNILQRPQSSSASRRTASHAGFFILSQSGERPER